MDNWTKEKSEEIMLLQPSHMHENEKATIKCSEPHTGRPNIKTQVRGRS